MCESLMTSGRASSFEEVDMSSWQVDF